MIGNTLLVIMRGWIYLNPKKFLGTTPSMIALSARSLNIRYLHTCYDGDRDLLAAHKKPFLVENGASSSFALVLAP